MKRLKARAVSGAVVALLITACGANAAGSANTATTVTVPGETVTVRGSTITVSGAARTSTVTATKTAPAVPPKTEVVTSTVEIVSTVEVTLETAPDAADDLTESAPAEPAEAAGEPITLSGTGDDVVDVELTDAMVLSFACPDCSSNTVLSSDGQDGLLVNEIGGYTGRHLVNLAGDVTQFEVNADAAWTINLEPTTVLATDANRESGHGDDVVYYDSGSKAAISHIGESNFAVIEYSTSDGRNLLVNEIGNYEGTVPLDTPCMVQINADGDWTVIPS